MTKQISAIKVCPWCESEMQLIEQMFDNHMEYPGYSLGRTVHEEWHCINSQCDCRMILDGKGDGIKIGWSKKE